MKITGLLFVTLICFQHTKAQRKMHFGLKGAPNIGWFQPKSEGLESDGAKMGFSYGLITDFVFNENYSFGTGLEVNHFGGKLSYNLLEEGVPGEYSQDITLQYLQIPLTLKMRTKEIGYFTYYGQFGFGVGGLISASGDVTFDNGLVKETKNDVNIYNDFKFFRASMILGLGAEYNISGTTSIVMGASFNNGFVNPLKGRVYDESDESATGLIEGDKKKANSNFVSINLGIIF